MSWWLSIMSSNLSQRACSWLRDSTPPPATERSSLFFASAFSNSGFTWTHAGLSTEYRTVALHEHIQDTVQDSSFTWTQSCKTEYRTAASHEHMQDTVQDSSFTWTQAGQNRVQDSGFIWTHIELSTGQWLHLNTRRTEYRVQITGWGISGNERYMYWQGGRREGISPTSCFFLANSVCLALASPISSTVCGLCDSVSMADVTKVSISLTSLLMALRSELTSASKSRWMWSSITAFTGIRFTVIQSTFAWLEYNKEKLMLYTFCIFLYLIRGVASKNTGYFILATAINFVWVDFDACSPSFSFFCHWQTAVKHARLTYPWDYLNGNRKMDPSPVHQTSDMISLQLTQNSHHQNTLKFPVSFQ